MNDHHLPWQIDSSGEDEAPMLNGRTFDEVLAHVHARAERMLPDAVVHVSDLRMTSDGHIGTTGGPRYRLNDHARRMLASFVGVRWGTWFGGAIPGEERADELNRRLSRHPGELKVRAWRDDTDEAAGVARAFLSPRFSPIDDARVFDRVHATLRGALDEYRFTCVEDTDSTTHYTAVHIDARDIRGDVHHPGWALRNSEVGAAALTLDDFWLRLACLLCRRLHNLHSAERLVMRTMIGARAAMTSKRRPAHVHLGPRKRGHPAAFSLRARADGGSRDRVLLSIPACDSFSARRDRGAVPRWLCRISA